MVYESLLACPRSSVTVRVTMYWPASAYVWLAGLPAIVGPCSNTNENARLAPDEPSPLQVTVKPDDEHAMTAIGGGGVGVGSGGGGGVGASVGSGVGGGVGAGVGRGVGRGVGLGVRVGVTACVATAFDGVAALGLAVVGAVGEVEAVVVGSLTGASVGGGGTTASSLETGVAPGVPVAESTASSGARGTETAANPTSRIATSVPSRRDVPLERHEHCGTPAGLGPATDDRPRRDRNDRRDRMSLRLPLRDDEAGRDRRFRRARDADAVRDLVLGDLGSRIHSALGQVRRGLGGPPERPPDHVHPDGFVDDPGQAPPSGSIARHESRDDRHERDEDEDENDELERHDTP